MLKRIKAVASRASLLTYLAGAGLISFGGSLIFLPAGVIAGGVLLIALVFETGGKK